VIASYKHSSLFGHSVSDVEKSFIKMTPGVNATTQKLIFSSSLTERPNKLERLSTASLSNQI
jgi:hypothetical protein